jgi:hypothetical protein
MYHIRDVRTERSLWKCYVEQFAGVSNVPTCLYDIDMISTLRLVTFRSQALDH